ncbi:MAG: hypothetical protein HUU20_08970 [Pirellulales bacterium]|nr:hypothetical protein [Pirellulales bacterium]
MLLLAETGPTTLFFLVAMMITIGLLLMRTQRYFGRQGQHPTTLLETSRSKAATPSHRFGAPPEMVAWEVSMHDTARDLSAQLDSKMAALEHLIREADRAAARIERALDAADQAGTIDPAFVPKSRSQELHPSNQAEALRSSGRTETSHPAVAGESVSERPSAGVRYQEIYTLADYGYPACEIAERVGSPVGEVELILSLRDRR